MREPEKPYQYTVSEIAAKTFTSKATVVRFAKAMGYGGLTRPWGLRIDDFLFGKQHVSESPEQDWNTEEKPCAHHWDYQRDEKDLMDLRRIKKDSFYWYQQVIRSNGGDLNDRKT